MNYFFRLLLFQFAEFPDIFAERGEIDPLHSDQMYCFGSISQLLSYSFCFHLVQISIFFYLFGCLFSQNILDVCRKNTITACQLFKEARSIHKPDDRERPQAAANLFDLFEI